MKKFIQEHPEFTVALGNEIYLTDTRENNQKYWHFILIAKNAIGHKGLRELSSQAWRNSYVDRRMERVPTLKSELKSIMSKYKGHIIATTACMGGELSTNAYAMSEAQRKGDDEAARYHYNQIIDFIKIPVNSACQSFSFFLKIQLIIIPSYRLIISYLNLCRIHILAIKIQHPYSINIPYLHSSFGTLSQMDPGFQ